MPMNASYLELIAAAGDSDITAWGLVDDGGVDWER